MPRIRNIPLLSLKGKGGILTSLRSLEVRRMFSLLYYSGILPREYFLVNIFLQKNFNIFCKNLLILKDYCL